MFGLILACCGTYSIVSDNFESSMTSTYIDKSANKVDRSHITALRRSFRGLRFFTMRPIHSVLNNSPNSSIFCGSKGDAQKYASESDCMRDGIHFQASKNLIQIKQIMRSKAQRSEHLRITTKRLHSVSGQYASISG